MPRISSVLLLLAGLSTGTSVALTPSLASAQRAPDRNQAREHFRAGVAAFQRNEFERALSEFETAYRLAPHPTVRVNIANCFMQLHRPVDALTFFEQYLTETPDSPTPQRREVQGQIEQLRGQIAEVRVVLGAGTPRDAIVSVDGQATSVQNVVRMMPGSHAIEVSADGFERERIPIDATAGLRREIVVQLHPPAPATPAIAPGTTATPATPGTSTTPGTPPPETTPALVITATPPATPPPETTPNVPPPITTPPVIEPPPEQRPEPRRGLSPSLFIISAASTGAVLVGWGVFGGLALSANGEFNEAANNLATGRSSPAAERLRGMDAATRATSFALASDVFLGLGIAGAATTAVLAVFTNFGPRERPRPLNAFSVSPVPLYGGYALAAGGRF